MPVVETKPSAVYVGVVPHSPFCCLEVCYKGLDRGATTAAAAVSPHSPASAQQTGSYQAHGRMIQRRVSASIEKGSWLTADIASAQQQIVSVEGGNARWETRQSWLCVKVLFCDIEEYDWQGMATSLAHNIYPPLLSPVFLPANFWPCSPQADSQLVKLAIAHTISLVLISQDGDKGRKGAACKGTAGGGPALVCVNRHRKQCDRVSRSRWSGDQQQPASGRAAL